MLVKKLSSAVARFPGNVPKIPGTVAFDELLERIVDRGVTLDGESQLTALAHLSTAPHMSATAKRSDISLISGINDAASRRRGAPMSRRERKQS